MKIFDKIGLATKDLVNRKSRTILTVLAISIGTLLLIVMMGISDGIVNKMKDMISSFGDINVVSVLPVDASKSGELMKVSMEEQETSSKLEELTDEEIKGKDEKKEDESFKKIDKEALEKISKLDGVREIYSGIQPSVTSVKLEDNDYIDRKIDIVGENTDYKYDHPDELIEGREISDRNNEVLVGESLIKRLGLENTKDIIGKKITVKIEYPKIEGLESMTLKEPLEVQGTVVGVLSRKPYSDMVVMSSKKADPIASFFLEDGKSFLDENGYSGVNVYPEEGVSGIKLSELITKELGYQTISIGLMISMFDSMSIVVKGVLSIGGIIVLVVAAIGLINTITMTLQEKKKMIGVMRSVGGARSHIRSIFIFQSTILGVFGGVLGMVLAIVGILISNEYLTKSSGFEIVINEGNIIASVLVTIIISIIAGAIPANKAAKLNVVEAVAEE